MAVPDLLAAYPSPAVRLMLFARQVEAWSPERAAKHKRDSRGRFVKVGDQIQAAFDADDTGGLDAFSREQLRREARRRNIPLRRGASREEISDALWDSHGGPKGDAASPHPIDERAELRAHRLAAIAAGGGARGKTRDSFQDRVDRADIAIDRYRDALKFEGQDDPRWDAELAEARDDLAIQGITISDLGYEIEGRDGTRVVLQPAELNGPTGEVDEIRKTQQQLAMKPAPVPGLLDIDSVSDVIRRKGGSSGFGPEYISILQLREEFPGLSDEEFAATLKRMDRAREIELVGYPDKNMLTAAEKNAGVSLGGEVKHMVREFTGAVQGPEPTVNHRQRWIDPNTPTTVEQRKAQVAAKAAVPVATPRPKPEPSKAANPVTVKQGRPSNVSWVEHLGGAATEAEARERLAAAGSSKKELIAVALAVGFRGASGMNVDALREKIIVMTYRGREKARNLQGL